MDGCKLSSESVGLSAAENIAGNLSVEMCATPAVLLRLPGARGRNAKLALTGMSGACSARAGSRLALTREERCALRAQSAGLPQPRPERIEEFARGRASARRALLELGRCRESVLIGRDGEPLWPAGVVGSISHTPDFACALAARGLRAVGVDVERCDRDLSERAWQVVLAGAKLERDSARERVAVFAIKEAFFKLAFPSTRQRFGFSAVSVRTFGPGLGCRVQLLRQLSGAFHRGATFLGNYVYGAGLVLAWFCIASEATVASEAVALEKTPPGTEQAMTWESAWR
jgi:4'-phosphopantetheinyl transferase EntD